MTTHQLIQRKVKLPDGSLVAYWQLRWPGTNGKPQTEAIGRAGDVTITGKDEKGKPIYRVRAKQGDMSRTDAEAERTKRNGEVQIGKRKRDKVTNPKLSELADLYRERRSMTNGDTLTDDQRRGYRRAMPKLNPATMDDHLMTIRYLTQHFGTDRRIASVTEDDAEDWIEALEAGELASARKPSKRAYTVKENTVRKHIRNAKKIFNWARSTNLIHANPFAEFDGTTLPGAGNPYVSVADMHKVIRACDHPWRVLFGLCRFAGLRRGEALSLVWKGQAKDKDGVTHTVGVDFERLRINLVARKRTAQYFRSIPICPALHTILSDAQAAQEAGETRVCCLSHNNLTKFGKAMVKRAKVKPWRKLYQSLRSSCENDWKERGIAEPTYCAWIGHNSDTSRKHYVAPMDSEFEIVTKAA